MPTARNTSKHKPCETKAHFSPLLPVGSQESVLKVPKRGQFHTAIRVTTKRRDSCAQGGNRRYRGETFPVLPFLVFLEFLVFCPCEEFLVFSSVFPFFSRDFRGSVGTKKPCFFGGFPCLFPKKQGKEGQGLGCGIASKALRRKILLSSLQRFGVSDTPSSGGNWGALRVPKGTCPKGALEFSDFHKIFTRFSSCTTLVARLFYQDDGKGGLSLRGVAFMTVLAVLMGLAVLEST